MKPVSYWQKRSEQVAARQFKAADDYSRELIREYDRAILTIQRDSEAFYQRFAANNEISLAEAQRLLTAGELKEFRMTLEEFTAKAKNNADGRWTRELNNVYYRTRVSRFETLQAQIRHEAEMLAGSRQAGARELLGGIYTDTYHRTLFELQRGTGIGVSFAQIDDRGLKTVLGTEFAGSNWSKRIWGDRDKLVSELRTRLMQSLIRGDSVDRTVRSLVERMGVSRSNAVRLVQTEAAFFTEQATMAGYKASGLVQEYEILATLDNRTSEICRQMDGKRFKVSEQEPGVNAPPFHAHCRTTTVPWFPDEVDPGERLARGDDGQTYTVPGDMTYEQWKKRYVDDKIQAEGGIVLKGDRYTPAYVQKLQDTYRFFHSHGFAFREHALNEVVGRVKQGRLPSLEAVLDTLRHGKTYIQADGAKLKYGNGMSVHIASDTGEIVSVVPRKKVRDEWREPDEGD